MVTFLIVFSLFRFLVVCALHSRKGKTHCYHIIAKMIVSSMLRKNSWMNKGIGDKILSIVTCWLSLVASF